MAEHEHVAETAPGAGLCIEGHGSKSGSAARTEPAAPAQRPNVTVVLPTRNDAHNLGRIADLLPPVDEIVVVDGASQDGTAQLARELWPAATVIEQTCTGKGNALVCGFGAATGDIIVTIDAATDPTEIPRLVQALTGGADLAKGTRFPPHDGSQVGTRVRRMGNRGLHWLVNRILKTQFSDLCYGNYAFWRRNLGFLDLPAADAVALQWGDGFEIATIFNVRAARSGWLIHEVANPGDDAGQRVPAGSNLDTVAEGLALMRALRGELRRRRTPAPPATGKGWSR